MKGAKKKLPPMSDFMKRAFELMDQGYQEPELIVSPWARSVFKRAEAEKQEVDKREARAARRRRASHR